MLDGHLLPHPPSVLAHIISITIVSAAHIPKDNLRSLFRVRRDAIRRALLWLKRHNPKYYGNIEISEFNLAAYPEDDVPAEILAITRQCSDVGVVEQEASGYVPSQQGKLMHLSCQRNSHASFYVQIYQLTMVRVSCTMTLQF